MEDPRIFFRLPARAKAFLFVPTRKIFQSIQTPNQFQVWILFQRVNHSLLEAEQSTEYVDTILHFLFYKIRRLSKHLFIENLTHIFLTLLKLLLLILLLLQ
jgi:hypothetical protein